MSYKYEMHIKAVEYEGTLESISTIFSVLEINTDRLKMNDGNFDITKSHGNRGRGSIEKGDWITKDEAGNMNIYTAELFHMTYKKSSEMEN